MKAPLFAFSLLLSLFGSSISTKTCSDHCTDYHRLCPAIDDSTFQQEYAQRQADGDFPNLPGKVLPDFDCNNSETKILCPMSCQECTPCSVSALKGVPSVEEFTALQEQIQSLQAEFQEIKDSGAALPKEEGRIFPIGMTADPPPDHVPQMTIDKLFDGSEEATLEHCYVARSSKHNQASIDIPPSAVTKLEFLNRKDWGPDLLNSISVRICVKGGACTFCGKPKLVAGGAWSTLLCQGALEGNEIRLKNDAKQLNLCELKIYGTPLPANKFTILKPIHPVGMLADAAWKGHPETTIEKAFEGDNDIDHLSCYISNAPSKVRASIDIPPAAVSQIQFLQRKECDTYEDGQCVNAIEVKVCVKGGTCQLCGNPNPVPGGAWSFLNCQGGALEGNEIQLYNPVGHLQFAEMKILGTLLDSDAFVKLVPIAVTGWLADPGLTATECIDTIFKGSGLWTTGHCYFSNLNTQSQASIDIEPAAVTQIKLLNRGDFNPDWMDEIQVKVCVKGGTCRLCGNTPETPGSGWGVLTCNGGPIEGNEIQLSNPTNNLQFCEIIVLGTRLENPSFISLKPIHVTGWEASPIIAGHGQVTIDKAFDDSEDVTGHSSCYISATIAGGDFAHIDIEEASVAQVKILNRKTCDPCVPWIKDIEVSVCEKGGDCSSCGNLPAVPGGAWAILNCQGGAIKGNQIRLTNPNNVLQFCEMKIYGTV